MSTHAILYLAAVGSGFAFLMWLASTIRTDAGGYTHIATFTSIYEAERACHLLEEAGIKAQLDDHMYGTRHGSRSLGTVRLLAADDRVDEAVRLLQSRQEDRDSDAAPA